MKKLVYILSCLFLLSTGFAACSSDYDEPEQPNSHQDEMPVDSAAVDPNNNPSADYRIISTVPVSDEVKAFFDEALPSIDIYGNCGESSFKMDENQYADHAGWPVYHVINDAEEFHERYKGNNVLPEIDFKQFTLIIGHCISGTPSSINPSCFYIEVLKYKDHNEVNFIEHNYYASGGSGFNYFWGLFPKIHGEFKGFTWNNKKWN